MIARIRKSMDEKDQGFTLIELLVVIIIIGILAAIAIPVFLNQRQKGWDAAIKSDLKNAATAQETFLTDSATGVYSAQTPVGSDLTGLGFKYSAAGNYSGTPAISVAVTGSFQSYRLCATSASTKVWVYDSALGGVQPAGTAC